MNRLLMNKKKYWCCIASVIVITISTGAIKAQELWTLDQCIEQALKNNLNIEQAANDKMLSKVDYEASKMNFLPSLNGGVSSNNTWGLYIDPTTNLLTSSSGKGLYPSLNSNLSIYEGMRKVNTVKEKQEAIELSNNKYHKTTNDITIQITQLYFQVLLDMEQVEKTKQQIKLTQLQVDRTQKLIEGKSIAVGELYNIQSQLATEELNLVNVQNSLDGDYLRLRQAVEVPAGKDFKIIPLVINDSTLMVQRSSLEEILGKVKNSAPEIKIAESNLKIAELNNKIAKSGLQPSLYASGSLGTRTSNLNPESIDKQLNINRSASLGITLSIPIFNNYHNKYSIASSEINYKNQKIALSIANKELTKTIENAYHEIVAAEKKYEAVQKQLTFLQESFKYESKKYELGINNAFTYNDAKNKMTQAELELSMAKYSYLMKQKILNVYLSSN